MPTTGTGKSITDYSYTITPILEPFNEYFFVETDNPDPYSFRFADKSSKYEKNAEIVATSTRFPDIKYEDSSTGRVNGGYIFVGWYTDGGEVVLQSYTSGDTNVKLKLPALKDATDYLIDTYAKKSTFFDNMDAVETALFDISVYSGSYIRGEIYKVYDYWYLSNSPYADQLFYLQSPYNRRDDQNLFASEIYPFRLTSIGFPSMMASVSQRLNSASSYEWDSAAHAHIYVTYGGETRYYGGQGSYKGVGINKNDIKQILTLGKNGTNITLDSVRKLLIDYSKVTASDDVPKTDALTWKSVYDTVGSGSWVKLVSIGETGGGYAWLYQNADGSYFDTQPTENGSEIYWGGHLGYASDTWVDGRYVNSKEVFVKGEKFEDHQTSNIILKDFTVPQVKYSFSYDYNSASGSYERVYTVTGITETKETVLFWYDSTEKVWTPSNQVFNYDCADIYTLSNLVNSGALDRKYLDMVTLTLDEVKALKVDKNTNTLPGEYYDYYGDCKPGTKKG